MQKVKAGDRVVFLGHEGISPDAVKAVGEAGTIIQIDMSGFIGIRFDKPVGYGGTHTWYVPDGTVKLINQQLFLFEL